MVGGQGISIMVFSVDETTNKVAVCAGVPEKSDKCKKLEVSEWLTAALKPLNGRCGKGKGGLATGQVSSDVVLKGLRSIYLFKFDICPRNKLNKLKPNMVNIINSIADARSTRGSLLILFVLNINIKIKYLMKLLMKIVLESAFKKKKKKISRLQTSSVYHFFPYQHYDGFISGNGWSTCWQGYGFGSHICTDEVDGIDGLGCNAMMWYCWLVFTVICSSQHKWDLTVKFFYFYQKFTYIIYESWADWIAECYCSTRKRNIGNRGSYIKSLNSVLSFILFILFSFIITWVVLFISFIKMCACFFWKDIIDKYAYTNIFLSPLYHTKL